MAKRQFGNNEQVTGGVLRRSKRRLKKLGAAGAGFNTSDGISGREARAIKAAAGGYTPKSRRDGKQATFSRPDERVQGKTVNNVASGPGSQRRGGNFTVRWDPNKKRFKHVYASGQSVTDSKRKEVVIRKDNPLTAQYQAKRKRKQGEKLSGTS